MKMTRKIYASKAEFIAELEQQLRDQEQASDRAARLAERNRAAGKAEGLRTAIAYVRDWQVEPLSEESETEALHEVQPPASDDPPIFSTVQRSGTKGWTASMADADGHPGT